MESKHYDKYFIKRHPSTLEVMIEDGKPVLGEIAKHDCPLEDRHVKVLNRGWKNSGIYFVEIEDKVDEKAIEKELRAKLFKEVNQLVIDGILEKAPAKNIKTEDLQTLINENK